MKSDPNKYGLKRYIEADTRRIIRQEAGFGCVICGEGITEYEHIDPEFNNAKEHDPNKMTLLCSSCHSKKTRGIYSKELIFEAKEKPKCKENGFAFDHLDFGRTEPIIQIGEVKFKNPTSLITIEGQSLISISSIDEKLLLNATFEDDDNELIRIEENTWIGNAENWDVEIEGKSITIRRRKGDVALKITNHPNDKFEIEKINITFRGYNIIGDKKELKIKKPNDEVLTLLTSEYGDGIIETKTAVLIQDGELKLSPQLTINTDINIKTKSEVINVCNQTVVGGSLTIKTPGGGEVFIGVPKEFRKKK